MTNELDKRAVSSIRVIENTTFSLRAKKLESIEEFGFALIFTWNMIEASLKLIRYGESIKEGWPDKLDRRWRAFQELKSNNSEKYDVVLGSSSRSLSLWKIRNEIAHEGSNVSVVEYSKYVEAALWLMLELQQKVPNLKQLGDKKRHSDAQFKKDKK